MCLEKFLYEIKLLYIFCDLKVFIFAKRMLRLTCKVEDDLFKQMNTVYITVYRVFEIRFVFRVGVNVRNVVIFIHRPILVMSCCIQHPAREHRRRSRAASVIVLHHLRCHSAGYAVTV